MKIIIYYDTKQNITIEPDGIPAKLHINGLDNFNLQQMDLNINTAIMCVKSNYSSFLVLY